MPKCLSNFWRECCVVSLFSYSPLLTHPSLLHWLKVSFTFPFSRNNSVIFVNVIFDVTVVGIVGVVFGVGVAVVLSLSLLLLSLF